MERHCEANAETATAQTQINNGEPTMSQQETLTQAAPETSGTTSSRLAPPQPPRPKRKAASGWWVLVGAILAPGKRAVTAALRVMGLAPRQSCQPSHRVLNRAVWSSLEGSRLLLQRLVHTLAPTGPWVMGWDDPIERRRGAKIQAQGLDRDPVRSSHSQVVKASGWRW